jgi:YbgC/YbaW family acyl-CoA thioester hydrolase
VRFAETDAMQIVHHGRYLPYLEEARVAYLRHLGHPYSEWRDQGTDSAVLEVHMRYVAPLRFDDEFDVHTALADVTRLGGTCVFNTAEHPAQAAVALIRDPTGAALFLYQIGSHQEATQ